MAAETAPENGNPPFYNPMRPTRVNLTLSQYSTFHTFLQTIFFSFFSGRTNLGGMDSPEAMNPPLAPQRQIFSRSTEPSRRRQARQLRRLSSGNGGGPNNGEDHTRRMLDLLQYCNPYPLARWCAGEELTTMSSKGCRSATTRLADPTTKNDAVRDAQDVEVTWTIE